MIRYFVTATGTEIGKTYVTAALTRLARESGRRVRALKPVVSGFAPEDLAASDPGILLAAAGLPATALDVITPWRFRAALSPDMAAAREGRSIDFEALLRFSRAGLAGPEEIVLIEGVGGAMVPLDERHTVLDWIQALGIPALVVAGSYLGTISHSLTTLAALRQRGVPVRALVLSESPQSPVPLAETAAVLARFVGEVEIVTVPRCESGNRFVPELADLLA
jgi:dethiobiotin synthetase